jgi:hypothetical protein
MRWKRLGEALRTLGRYANPHKSLAWCFGANGRSPRLEQGRPSSDPTQSLPQQRGAGRAATRARQSVTTPELLDTHNVRRVNCRRLTGACRCRSEGLQLGNVIHWANAGAALLFLLFALIVLLAVVFAYPALWGVPYGGALTVSCLNRLLWHWKEFKPLDRFWMIVIGGLLGPVIVAGSLTGWQKGEPALYVGILVVGLLLAAVMEAKSRKPVPSPSPDNSPPTDL